MEWTDINYNEWIKRIGNLEKNALLPFPFFTSSS